MLIWSDISKWSDLLPAITDPIVPPCSSSLTAANLAKLLGPQGLYCPWHQQKSRVSIHPEANPASQPGETSASSAILQVFKGMGRAHAFFHWPWEIVVAKKKLSALPEKDLPHTQKGCVWDQSSYFGAIQRGGQRETPSSMNTRVLSADTYPSWTRMDINELQLIKTYQRQLFAGSVDNQICYFPATPEGEIRCSLLYMKYFSWGSLMFHIKANTWESMLFIT